MTKAFFRSRSTVQRRAIMAAALVLAVSACNGRIDARGNEPDPDRLAEIQVGQHTRQQVVEFLGSPSSTSVFDGEAWYYISKRTETVAFWAPDIQQRQVVVIRFDTAGVVQDVEALDQEDTRTVQLVDRETPTSGNELTVIDQLLGNIGRFGKETER